MTPKSFCLISRFQGWRRQIFLAFLAQWLGELAENIASGCINVPHMCNLLIPNLPPTLWMWHKQG